MRKIIGNRWYDTEKSTLLASGTRMHTFATGKNFECEVFNADIELYRGVTKYFFYEEESKNIFTIHPINVEMAFEIFNLPDMKQFVSEEDAFGSIPQA